MSQPPAILLFPPPSADYPWQSQHQCLLYSLNPVVFTSLDLSAGFATTGQSLLLVSLLFSFWQHFTDGPGWLTRSIPAQGLNLRSTFTNASLSQTHPQLKAPFPFPPDLSAQFPVFCLSSNYHRLQWDMLGSFYTPSFPPELYLISRDCCRGKTLGRAPFCSRLSPAVLSRQNVPRAHSPHEY